MYTTLLIIFSLNGISHHVSFLYLRKINAPLGTYFERMHGEQECTSRVAFFPPYIF